MKRTTIFWTIIWAICQIGIGLAIKEIGYPKEYTLCGEVIDKAQPESIKFGKYSGRLQIDNLFVVRFDNGEVKDMNVTDYTWYNNDKGDRVCFDFEDRESPFILMPYAILGFVGVVWDYVLIVIGIIILYNKYIYTEE